MRTTTTLPGGAEPAAPGQTGGELASADDVPATALTESLLDSLPAWTVVAAAVALLYLVWATIEILGRYVGPLPSVGP